MPFSGFADLDPLFAQSLQRLIAENQGISPFSGYRSPQRQAVLYANALKKYGSPAAARKWVAPPGRSFHGKGQAVDLHYANAAARARAHQVAAQYGLIFPLSNEPWHIEPIGARGQRQAGVTRGQRQEGVTKAVTPTSPQQAVDQAPFQPMRQQQQQQQPLSQQFLAGLDFSPQTLFKNRLFEGIPNPEQPFSGQTFMSDLMAGASPLRRPIVQGLSRLFGLG